jgi:hypothetical protein
VPVRGTFSLVPGERESRRNFLSARTGTGREIKFYFSSYRHGRENIAPRRAGTSNFLSLVPVRGTFSLLVPGERLKCVSPRTGRERKLSSSSCRYEELSLPRTGTTNFLSARTGTGREIEFCFTSYRHGRESLVSRRAGTRNFLSLVPVRGTLSLLVPGEGLSCVSPRTGTGEKT